ncbi:hypothetical protein KW803_01130, partial [Candidatus Saccharibacteria bacterium]|nr:hypothetical protein [Candidatus Saccharibacteria bacterium]
MKRFRRTTLIAVFCISVLAGLGMAQKVTFAPNPAYLLALPLLLLLKRKDLITLLIIIVLGACAGLWRGGVYMQYAYQLKSLAAQKVTIQATSTTDAVYSALFSS